MAMILSGLEPHPSNSVELEQYTTDGDLASRWLSDIAAFGDLSEGCAVADLGAGNGVLGLGIEVENDILTPRKVITLKDVEKIACGEHHNMALVKEKIESSIIKKERKSKTEEE